MYVEKEHFAEKQVVQILLMINYGMSGGRV